jgi:hypothetical protein
MVRICSALFFVSTILTGAEQVFILGVNFPEHRFVWVRDFASSRPRLRCLN